MNGRDFIVRSQRLTLWAGFFKLNGRAFGLVSADGSQPRIVVTNTVRKRRRKKPVVADVGNPPARSMRGGPGDHAMPTREHVGFPPHRAPFLQRIIRPHGQFFPVFLGGGARFSGRAGNWYILCCRMLG